MEQKRNYLRHSWPPLTHIMMLSLEHGHDDNVHIYVYIISTTLTMSAASAPLHTYVLRAWLS